MRSHEKRVNVCPRTQGKYLVSVVLTAVFAIASLFGTLLFSTDTVADAAESQAVAQVGNATYASVQEAFGRTTLKNTTVTLLADVTESVTIMPPKGVRNVTFDFERSCAASRWIRWSCWVCCDHCACEHAAHHCRPGNGYGWNTACGRLSWRIARGKWHVHFRRDTDALLRNG